MPVSGKDTKRMTNEIRKRVKSYLRISIMSLLLSVGFVWLMCFFNECPLRQAFVRKETKGFAWFAVGGNVYWLATCTLVIVMNLWPLPKLPGGSWKREQLIVCKYSELAFSAIAVMCVALGGGMLYGGLLNLNASDDNSNGLEAVLILGIMGIVFVALGSVFIMYMKNYRIIFYPEGVFYQNLFGKVYVATNEQIEYVSIIPAYQKRSLRLHTVDRDLWLNSYCSCYHEAEKYALSHYTDFADNKSR